MLDERLGHQCACLIMCWEINGNEEEVWRGIPSDNTISIVKKNGMEKQKKWSLLKILYHKY